MIRETITFNFEDEAQQRRFHARLNSEGDAVLAEREACAKLAELQAALDRRNAERHRDTDNSFDDCAITAETIARSIRFRSTLEQQ